MSETASLLLVTHVHLRQGPNGLQIDDQTAAGIEQWCRHFGSVSFYGIMIKATATGPGSTVWVDTHLGVLGARVRFFSLPYAYGIGKMARHYTHVRAQLRNAVASHSHLCFTLGNIIGDWPAVAALAAIGQKRRFSAWIDRVEPTRILDMLAANRVKRVAAATVLPVLESGTRYILRHSTVALLQGRDTYDYYAGSAPDPHCTYDTHTRVDDQIAPVALARKQARVLSGAPLNIVYVGRAATMKGPFDWLETLARLHRQGIAFHATWIGDGPDLSAMRQRIDDLNLTNAIDLPGFENRREILLRKLEESDLLLFCHRTAKSARCLIEALVCGCPIVGYDMAYPRGLVEERGGGVLVPWSDVALLTTRMVQLHEDRPYLARLIAEAAASGQLYDEDTVYAHRAELMRRG